MSPPPIANYPAGHAGADARASCLHSASGKTPNICGFGTPQHACPHVWAPSSPVLKLLGFTGFLIVSFIPPVQLLALTTPTYHLWLGTFKKKGLHLAPSVPAEWWSSTVVLPKGRRGRGEAGARHGHRSKSQPSQSPPARRCPESLLTCEHGAGERLGGGTCLGFGPSFYPSLLYLR